MNRRNLLFAGLGTGAVAAGLGWSLVQHSEPAATDAETASLWGLRMERPEGGELALAALRGKPVLLNFWATWCPPCIREFPLLDRFQREHGPAGWQVVGLAVDNAEAVRQFLAKTPVSFKVGIVGFEGLQLTRELGNTVGALPFTVVLDGKGRLRERKLGEVDLDLLQAWATKLRG